MIKDEKKVIIFSIIGGLALWIFDSFIDSIVFSRGSFWSLLIGDMHELFMRSIFLISFILFGVVVSRLLSKHKKVVDALTESEKRYQMLFETAGDAIFILDAEGEKAGQIVAANKAAAEIHGYAIDELLTLNIRDLDTPDAAKDAPERIRRMLNGEWIKEEITHRKRDGAVFPVEISAGFFEFKNHKYILAFDRDITGRKSTEKALKESEEKYRSLVESTGDSIYLVDRNYRYLFMNKKHLSRLGFTVENFHEKAFSDFHLPEETKEFIENVDKVFETGESVQHEHFSRRDNRYFLRTLSPVKAADGRTIAVTVVSKDINELKQMEEKLRALSLTDELTGLYNRRGFFTLVEQLLKIAKREKRGMFMLYADLDHLKGINDTWDHQQGDLALIDTAKIFRTTFRESDIIARIGGDEFVVIPVGSTGDNIEMITARFQKNVEEHNLRGSREFNLSISFGISYYDPESPTPIDKLLLQAEKLMYEQKMNKRKQ